MWTYQKPGRDSGVARTPQKIKHSVNIKLARLPPVSALSMPAMIMFVKDEVKSRNSNMKRKKSAPRSCTASVAAALL